MPQSHGFCDTEHRYRSHDLGCCNGFPRTLSLWSCSHERHTQADRQDTHIHTHTHTYTHTPSHIQTGMNSPILHHLLLLPASHGVLEDIEHACSRRQHVVTLHTVTFLTAEGDDLILLVNMYFCI